MIAELAHEHDLLVVTDEVYEHLVFDGEHVPIATLPGMRDRTVTISSGGQDVLVHRLEGRLGVRAARARRPRCKTVEAVPHLREAAAVPARDRGRAAARPTSTSPRSAPTCATSAIASAPGSPTPASTCFRPQGTYFVTSTSVRSASDDGLAFCRALPAPVRGRRRPERRVLRRRDAGAPLVRFACCKRPEVLDEACTRLKALARSDRRRHPARHRVGGPGRELRAPRADDRAGPPRTARGSSCSPRCTRPGSR